MRACVRARVRVCKCGYVCACVCDFSFVRPFTRSCVRLCERIHCIFALKTGVSENLVLTRSVHVVDFPMTSAVSSTSVVRLIFE